MQLSTIPNTIEIPPRVEAEPLRDRSERVDSERPFDRELGEAASRYERTDSGSTDRSETLAGETGASSPSDETHETNDEVAVNQDGEPIDDDTASESDSEQTDQVETAVTQEDEAVVTAAEPDDASLDVPIPELEELASEPVIDTEEAAQPQLNEAIVPDGDDVERQAVSAQATSESAAPLASLATVKSAGDGPSAQGLVERSQSTSGKTVDPAVAPGAVVETANADGSSAAGTSDGESGGDVNKQKSGAPVLTTTATTQSGSTDAAARPATLSNAAVPIQATAPGASSAAPNLAQTLASVTTPETDADPINAARLTRGLQSALQQPGGTVTLRLTPPELGTVRIQLQLSSGSVSASFHAEGASARSMLTQQLSQLRTALESQGLNVERLNVQPMQQTSQSSLQQQNQQSTADGRSRGQYTGQQQQSRDDRSDSDQPSRESFEHLMLNEVA